MYWWRFSRTKLSCNIYKGIKFISHRMKLWERTQEARMRNEVEIKQFRFMPRKSTINVLFALRMLMEKYREGLKELYSVFVDLEKRLIIVCKEERYGLRKSGVGEKYTRAVQDMYKGCESMVRCAVGVSEGFKIEVELHQSLQW